MIVAGVLLSALAAAPIAHAQQKGKKEYTFKGKVEKVDEKAKTLTVANWKFCRPTWRPPSHRYDCAGESDRRRV